LKKLAFYTMFATLLFALGYSKFVEVGDGQPELLEGDGMNDELGRRHENMCKDAKDEKAWPDLITDLRSCGKEVAASHAHGLRALGVLRGCLVAKKGFSKACAVCTGGLAACRSLHCRGQCGNDQNELWKEDCFACQSMCLGRTAGCSFGDPKDFKFTEAVKMFPGELSWFPDVWYGKKTVEQTFNELKKAGLLPKPPAPKPAPKTPAPKMQADLEWPFAPCFDYKLGVPCAGHFLDTAGPSGHYYGHKSVMFQDIKVNIQTVAPGYFSMTVTGIPGSHEVDCPKEAYAMSGDTLTMPNMDKQGDCAHDQFKAADLEFKGATYDPVTDEITVKTKYSFIHVTIVCKKTSAVVHEALAPLEKMLENAVFN